MRREITLALCYWACAVLFKSLYVQGTQEYHLATLPLLTEFKADRPFQYRILLPLLVHGWQAVFPGDPHQAYQFLTIAFTFGLFVAFRLYLRLFLPDGFSAAATLALLYPLLWNYCLLGTFFYASDIPSIFFFVVGLICLRRRSWPLFYANFFLATLNRETNCFLAVALLVTMPGELRGRYIAAHLLALTAVWLAIKWALTVAFARNAGAPVFENHLQDNIVKLTALMHGDPHMTGVAVSMFGLAWLFIPLAWREQPCFFKRLLWITIPFIGGMTVVGNLDEVRIYGELIPIVLAPALFSLFRLLGPGRFRDAATTPAAGRSAD